MKLGFLSYFPTAEAVALLVIPEDNECYTDGFFVALLNEYPTEYLRPEHIHEYHTLHYLLAGNEVPRIITKRDAIPTDTRLGKDTLRNKERDWKGQKPCSIAAQGSVWEDPR